MLATFEAYTQLPRSTHQLVHHTDHTLEIVVRDELELADVLALHCDVSLHRRLLSLRPMRLAAVKAGTSSSCRMKRAIAIELTRLLNMGDRAH